MRLPVKVVATLVLLLSTNLYAAHGRNCWDPSTWGGDTPNSGTTELSEMPMAFLNDSNVRTQLMRLMNSHTHAEAQTIKLERTQSKDQEIFVFTSTKEFMPPSMRHVTRFTITIPATAKGAMDWRVSEIREDC